MQQTFELLGRNVTFKNKECIYFGILKNEEYKSKLREIYNQQEPEFQKELEAYKNSGETVTNYEGYFREIRRIGEKYLNPGLEYILSILCQYKLYDITLGDLTGNKYQGYSDWYSSLHEIFKAFREINDAVAEIKSNAADYRNENEVNWKKNGEWVGGGFGIQGALKGAMTASFMNAASSALHGAVNLVGNTFVNYKSGSTVRVAIKTADDARRAVYEAQKDRTYSLEYAYSKLLYVLREVLVDNGIVEAPDYVKEDSAEQRVYGEKTRYEKQCKMLNNVERVADIEMKKDILAECVRIDPLSSDVYITILEHFPEALSEVERIFNFIDGDIEAIKYKTLRRVSGLLLTWWKEVVEKNGNYESQIVPYSKLQEARKKLADGEKRTGWISQRLRDEMDYVEKCCMVEYCKVIDISTDFDFKTLKKAKIVDGQVVIEDEISLVEKAEAAKEEVRKIYESLKVNDEEDLKNAKSKITVINRKYKLAEDFLKELDYRLAKIDLEKRTFDGILYATREEAKSVEERTLDGITYDTLEEKNEAEKEGMKILEILENGVSNGDDGELLDAWKKIKNIKFVSKNADLYLNTIEQEICKRYQEYLKEKEELAKRPMGMKIDVVLCVAFTIGGLALMLIGGIILKAIGLYMAIAPWKVNYYDDKKKFEKLEIKVNKKKKIYDGVSMDNGKLVIK